MDWKIILWSVAVFIGSGLLFRAIADTTSDSGTGVTLAAQGVALAIIVGVVVFVVRKREK